MNPNDHQLITMWNNLCGPCRVKIMARPAGPRQTTYTCSCCGATGIFNDATSSLKICLHCSDDAGLCLACRIRLKDALSEALVEAFG